MPFSADIDVEVLASSSIAKEFRIAIRLDA